MTAFTFDSMSHPVRRKASARPRARVVAPAALAPRAIAAPARDKPRLGTIALAGVIIALHAAGIVSLSGGKRSAAAPQPVPVTITFAQPRVIPPPPEPPKPLPQTPRLKTPAPARPAPAPAPVAAPIVAADTPMVAAASDTVQVATAPLVAPAPPAPQVEEPVTEPRGYAGYLRNPAPDYPVAAQKRGLEGQVVLKVHVLASGQPDSVAVARSSGHAILDDAALKAVLQWAFAPARRGKTAIDGWVQVPLNFKI